MMCEKHKAEWKDIVSPQEQLAKMSCQIKKYHKYRNVVIEPLLLHICKATGLIDFSSYKEKYTQQSFAVESQTSILNECGHEIHSHASTSGASTSGN